MDQNRHRPSSRRQLDDYLDSLSPWDLLYLRRKFRQDLFIHGLAGMEDLPSEITILIAKHLPLTSIIRCQRASRAWRQQWTSQDVVRDICRRYFPGTKPLHTEYEIETWYEVFARESRRQMCRRFRKHPRTLVRWNANANIDTIPIDPPPQPHSEAQDTQSVDLVEMGYLDAVLYCRGRVAWQPNRSLVLVDDLRTDRRKRCTLGHEVLRGRRLSLVCFTERLLVFLQVEEENQGRTLHVWNIDLEEWRKIVLPTTMVCCHGKQNSLVVGLRRRTGELLKWSWYTHTASILEEVEELNVAPNGIKRHFPYGQVEVMFHPSEQDVFFAVYVHMDVPDSFDYCCVVVKYSGMKPVRRYEHYVAALSLESPRCSYASLDLDCRCQPIHQHGLFSIMTTIEHRRRLNRTPASTWSCLCFDTVAESFSTLSFEPFYDEASRLTPCNLMGEQYSDFGVLAPWGDELLRIVRHTPFEERRNSEGERLPMLHHALLTDINGDKVQRESKEKRWPYQCMNRGPGAVIYNIFTDDDFVIIVSRQGLLVWTLSNITPPGSPHVGEWAIEPATSVPETRNLPPRWLKSRISMVFTRDEVEMRCEGRIYPRPSSHFGGWTEPSTSPANIDDA